MVSGSVWQDHIVQDSYDNYYRAITHFLMPYINPVLHALIPKINFPPLLRASVKLPPAREIPTWDFIRISNQIKSDQNLGIGQ